MVFKWFLNGFLNGLFGSLIVTSLTSTNTSSQQAASRSPSTSYEKDIERRQRLFRAFAAREHGWTPAEPQRSTSEEESILEEFCKVKNTNARPGTLQAAPACNAPNPGENDGIRKNEEKKRGEGLATGNQNGYG